MLNFIVIAMADVYMIPFVVHCLFPIFSYVLFEFKDHNHLLRCTVYSAFFIPFLVHYFPISVLFFLICGFGKADIICLQSTLKFYFFFFVCVMLVLCTCNFVYFKIFTCTLYTISGSMGVHV